MLSNDFLCNSLFVTFSLPENLSEILTFSSLVLALQEE